MKKQLQSLLAILLIMLIVPMIPLLDRRSVLQEANQDYSDKNSILQSEAAKPSKKEEQTISVYLHRKDTVKELPMSDYVKGVVCAEISPLFHPEAIKAQAVIAQTYTLRIRQLEKASPTETLKGADISSNPDTHQAYYTPQEIKKRYGKQYDTYWKTISDCVDEVLNQVLTYEEKPIIAAFHAISSGSTESSENVWGQSLPYLIPITSQGDTESPHYTGEKSFTAAEAEALLKKAFPEIQTDGKKEDWFQIKTNTPSGYVDEISVLNINTTGQKIRSIFGLKSADFTVSYQDGKFTFSTKGYGHGVGLSQYGADWFARQGKSYQEILAHYYPGTVLQENAF